MKSRTLHALVLCAASFVACKTGGGSGGGKGSMAIDPATQVAEVDGKALTYGELQADPEVGAKLRQAEVKALTELYEQRKGLLDELISRKLLEEQAKAKGKTLEQWYQTEFMTSVAEPSDDEAKAFFEEHKAEVPGQKFEDLKPRIKDAIRQQKLRDNMGKILADLKEKHQVKVQLGPPDLPRIEVEAKGPVRGPANAKVTIVEFSDFQCPYCGREYPVIERLMKEYDGKVRLVFRHYPLEFHNFAAKAAEAGACAQDQGKFWELHDKMFTNQSKLAVDDLKGYAKSLGMDAAKFDKCLDSGEKKPLVDEDLKAGAAAGVNGTPAFFINGLFVNGAQPYEQMKQTVDRELNQKG
ncbi:MAG TPA: thioredoxin domain-containing protein [Myxococcales bacterium]|nr:thioredoxin domain-containing protein [Myxococcales bacterium]